LIHVVFFCLWRGQHPADPGSSPRAVKNWYAVFQGIGFGGLFACVFGSEFERSVTFCVVLLAPD
jgi:hypothetical protein